MTQLKWQTKVPLHVHNKGTEKLTKHIVVKIHSPYGREVTVASHEEITALQADNIQRHVHEQGTM